MHCRYWHRGVRARSAFARDYAALYATREKRRYCEECEGQYAARYCKACGDKYCLSCWNRVHTKGRKRFHCWDNIEIAVTTVYNPQSKSTYGYFPQFDGTTVATTTAATAAAGAATAAGGGTNVFSADASSYYEHYGQHYAPQDSNGYYDERGQWVYNSSSTAVYAATDTYGYDHSQQVAAHDYSYDTSSYGYADSSSNSSAGGSKYGVDALGQRTLGDWTEYYDDSAQATYWYKAGTGEASWIEPTV
jgi:hypothetical protein